jgi:signal transduction histidine kinase
MVFSIGERTVARFVFSIRRGGLKQRGFSLFLIRMHNPILSTAFRRQLLAFICCCLFTTFLSAQNKDSLVSAYREASLSRNTAKIALIAEQLGLYYEAQGDADSTIYYFSLTEKHAPSRAKKADATYHISKATMFSKPSFSLATGKRGYALVADTACSERANLCNVMGIYYSLNGKYDSSLYFYTIALSTAEKIKDTKVAQKVKANLGDLYSYMGDHANALKYQLEVLNVQQRENDSVGIIRSFINVGNTYNYMHDDSIALEYYMRAYPSLKDKKNRMAGNLFNSIAVAYEDLSDTLKDTDPKWKLYTAMQKSFLEQSLAVKTALNDSLGIANTVSNFGRLAVRMKNIPEAIRYFNESMTIAEKINNPRIIRINCLQLGNLYMSQKEYSKALVYFVKMNEMGVQDDDLDAQHDALQGIFRAYEAMGDYKNAFDYLLRFRDVQGKLDYAEKQKRIAEAEAKYKNQEKQRENDKLLYENQLKTIAHEKAEQEKRWILLFSAGALLLVLLIFYLFYRNAQIKAKAKEEQEITKAVFASEQKERIRISRDLHDNVGTQLSLISNDIEWITHPLKTFTETEKTEKLELIGNASKEVINTLRETIWALNKEEVSFEEFADKLKAHVQKQVKLTQNVQPSFSENLQSTIMLGPSEALGLFRICQEAIANSLKYAKSEKLDISLSTQNGKYKLVISDHGKGFDKSAAGGENYGLANMQFRAEEISCTIDIVSSPEKGTVVTISKK